jgi:hypothetical protein
MVSGWDCRPVRGLCHSMGKENKMCGRADCSLAPVVTTSYHVEVGYQFQRRPFQPLMICRSKLSTHELGDRDGHKRFAMP